jgi:PAS domain S-box-containing protein
MTASTAGLLSHRTPASRAHRDRSRHPLHLAGRVGIPALLACVAVLGATVDMAAQAVRVERGVRTITQYGIDRWDDRHGLPQNAVQAVAQTRDGYMWVGTQNGVARFDGVRFVAFGRDAGPALDRPYVWVLHADPDGGLWIGTEEGGLVRHRDGEFRAWGAEQGLRSKWVTSLHKDGGGTLWIGTMDGGLARMRGDRVEHVDSTIFPARRVWAITEDRNGAVWVGSPRGLTRIRGDSSRTLGAADGLPGGSVVSVVPANDGGLWIGAVGGFAHYRSGSVRRYDATHGLPDGTMVRDIVEDPDGTVWLGTTRGLARLRAGRVEFIASGEVPGSPYMRLHRDREGSLWIGSGVAGLMRLRATPLLPVGQREGLAGDATTAVLQTADGSIWIGTENGLNRLRPGETRVFDERNGGLPSNVVYSLAPGADGGVWVGTANGVAYIRGERSTHFGRGDGLAFLNVRTVFEDVGGTLWIGSHDGLQRVSRSAPRLFTVADGLRDNFVLSLGQTSDGTLWIGTQTGLTTYADDSLTAIPDSSGISDGAVLSMYEDAEGALWAGGTGGLSVRRPGDSKFYTITVRDGLCSEPVYSIREDDSGRLWMSSHRGVFAISRADVAAHAAGRLATVPCREFGRTEGMRHREANGAISPAAWRMHDGRVWVSTIAGIVIVDPADLSSRLGRPPVVIEEVIADDRRYATPSRLPAGTRAIEIHFTGLSFVAPEKMRFRYRLAGLDGDWIDSGTRRVAYFTNLPPGRYRFHVQAANAEGEWNTAGASIGFELLPRPWQTWWFQVLAALVTAGALIALYAMRTRTLRRRAAHLACLAEERGRAEARFRDLFENATDAVFTTDVAGRLTALNRTAEELTGYAREAAVGMDLRELLPATEAGEEVARAWLAGTGTAAMPAELVGRDGTAVPVEVSTRIVWAAGERAGTQAIARDVRERNALERQLRQSQKMEAVGQLAGGVAHDFNNLLTVIRGNAEILLMDPLDDDVATGLNEITATADRATGLTRQLLAFSRKQSLQPRVLDLNEVVRSVEPMVRRLIGEDVAIAHIYAPRPAPVLADAGQLEQVLINLAVNARDAMSHGGTLTFEVALGRADDIVLRVADTGHGMDAETLSRVYEPFFTTKEVGKGTGLGLSTVYGIVRQAGGTVECESAPGMGTTFQIALPRVPSEEIRPARGETRAAVPGGAETVLLIEDDDAVRALAARILRHQGYTVIEARHGLDALQIADAYPDRIDIAVTDMVMPALSGREVAERLAERRPGVRVLMMSGYTDDEILRRGLSRPGTAFLEKPFTVEGLARAVREVLDRDEPGLSARRLRAI